MIHIKKLFENNYYQDLTDMMVILSDTFDGFIDIDIHSNEFYIMENYSGLCCDGFLQNSETFDEFIKNNEEGFDDDGFKIVFEYDPKFKFFNSYCNFYTKLLAILNSINGRIKDFGYCLDPESTGFGEIDADYKVGVCIGFQKIK